MLSTYSTGPRALRAAFRLLTNWRLAKNPRSWGSCRSGAVRTPSSRARLFPRHAWTPALGSA
eukprot:2045832-Pleurochrysis_carterae.AAC.1